MIVELKFHVESGNGIKKHVFHLSKLMTVSLNLAVSTIPSLEGKNICTW